MESQENSNIFDNTINANDQSQQPIRHQKNYETSILENVNQQYAYLNDNPGIIEFSSRQKLTNEKEPIKSPPKNQTKYQKQITKNIPKDLFDFEKEFSIEQEQFGQEDSIQQVYKKSINRELSINTQKQLETRQSVTTSKRQSQDNNNSNKQILIEKKNGLFNSFHNDQLENAKINNVENNNLINNSKNLNLSQSQISNSNRKESMDTRSKRSRSKHQKQSVQTHQALHQIKLNKLDKEKMYSLQETLQQKEYREKLKQRPLMINRGWKILQKYLFNVKQSAIFSPFIVQKQLNDLSAANANFDNIGDIDDDIEKKQRTKTFTFHEKIENKLFELYQKINLLNPNSNMSILSDIILYIVDCIVIFYISINIFYEYSIEYQNPNIMFIFSYIVPFFFVLDIVKELITAIYIKGFIKRDHKYIFHNYIKTLLIFDFISLLPVIKPFLDLFALDREYEQQDYRLLNTFIKMFIFFKLKSMKIKNQRIMKIFQRKQSLQLWSELFSLCTFILTLSHICAILYHTLGWVQIDYLQQVDSTWLHQADLIGADSWPRYLTSLFCSTSSMITVLIYIPQTQYEEFYLTIIMIINCGVFGYSINELGLILSDIKRNSKELKQDLNIINRYLVRKKVSDDLKAKIRNYLEYIHTQRKDLNNDEVKNIKNKLNESLREDLKRDVNQQHLSKCSFFVDYFPTILHKIYSLGEELSFSNDEIIIQENTTENLDFFLIVKGAVQIIQQVGKRDMPYTQLQTLKSGEFFGHHEFITGLARASTVQSLEYTTVLRIERQKFLDVLNVPQLKENQDGKPFLISHDQKIVNSEFEQFSMLRHKLLTNQFSYIRDKCFSCNRQHHIAINCPTTHLIFNQIKTQRLLQSHDQVRIRYFRPTRQPTFNNLDQSQLSFNGMPKQSQIEQRFRGYNSRLSNELIYNQCVQYVLNNEMVLQKYDLEWHYRERHIDDDYSEGYFTDEDDDDDDDDLDNDQLTVNQRGTHQHLSNNQIDDQQQDTIIQLSNDSPRSNQNSNSPNLQNINSNINFGKSGSFSLQTNNHSYINNNANNSNSFTYSHINNYNHNHNHNHQQKLKHKSSLDDIQDLPLQHKKVSTENQLKYPINTKGMKTVQEQLTDEEIELNNTSHSPRRSSIISSQQTSQSMQTAFAKRQSMRNDSNPMRRQYHTNSNMIIQRKRSIYQRIRNTRKDSVQLSQQSSYLQQNNQNQQSTIDRNLQLAIFTALTQMNYRIEGMEQQKDRQQENNQNQQQQQNINQFIKQRSNQYQKTTTFNQIQENLNNNDENANKKIQLNQELQEYQQYGPREKIKEYAHFFKQYNSKVIIRQYNLLQIKNIDYLRQKYGFKLPSQKNIQQKKNQNRTSQQSLQPAFPILSRNSVMQQRNTIFSSNSNQSPVHPQSQPIIPKFQNSLQNLLNLNNNSNNNQPQSQFLIKNF